MALSLSLMKAIFQLFIILGLGMSLVKFKVLESKDSKIISKMLIYIVTPCMIIKSFQVEYTNDKLMGLAVAFIGAIVVNTLYIVLAQLLQKPLGLERIEKATMIYSNAGNLVIPLVSAIPALGDEWVLYTSGYIVVQTIMLWTHGVSLISGENQFSIKKIVTNVNIISIVIGLILFFAHIQIPDLFGTVISNMSNMMGPLSMIVIGMLFADMDFKTIFKDKRTYVICFFRLIAFPLVAICLLKLLPLGALSSDYEKILLITTLAACAPAASMVTQFAQLFDKHPGYASVMNVMSVMFSLLTMPLMIMLYQML